MRTLCLTEVQSVPIACCLSCTTFKGHSIKFKPQMPSIHIMNKGNESIGRWMYIYVWRMYVHTHMLSQQCESVSVPSCLEPGAQGKNMQTWSPPIESQNWLKHNMGFPRMRTLCLIEVQSVPIACCLSCTTFKGYLIKFKHQMPSIISWTKAMRV